ncbi:MAG: molybdenum cofactor biosynthesis protein MoaE [Novosphingobium sp.]|uniref:molybdenum cofactor biosynthesis protein MoaE n=1 Tax=Novosphingobium sp. TaxID=1874826 RepID=UPI003C7C7523
MIDVRLLDQPFVPSVSVADFGAAHAGLGALCSFVGEVRGESGVEALELSHYAPLTLPGMEALAQRAVARFSLQGLLIVHRTGELLPGEPIVLVAAAASHRRAAFDAVDFAMDNLKSRAWFWKREKRGGHWSWIEPRAADYADLARWD